MAHRDRSSCQGRCASRAARRTNNPDGRPDRAVKEKEPPDWVCPVGGPKYEVGWELLLASCSCRDVRLRTEDALCGCARGWRCVAAIDHEPCVYRVARGREVERRGVDVGHTVAGEGVAERPGGIAVLRDRLLPDAGKRLAFGRDRSGEGRDRSGEGRDRSGDCSPCRRGCSRNRPARRQSRRGCSRNRPAPRQSRRDRSAFRRACSGQRSQRSRCGSVG